MFSRKMNFGSRWLDRQKIIVVNLSVCVHFCSFILSHLWSLFQLHITTCRKSWDSGHWTVVGFVDEFFSPAETVEETTWLLSSWDTGLSIYKKINLLHRFPFKTIYYSRFILLSLNAAAPVAFEQNIQVSESCSLKWMETFCETWTS